MHAPRRRPTLEESELVERARGGEAAAYEMLVRRYQALAFRVAFVLLGDAAEAEDAAQEAFLKAWQALPRFRAGAPLRPWLLRIVANEARNRRSAAARRCARPSCRQPARIRHRPRMRRWPPSAAPRCWRRSTACAPRNGW